MSGSGNVRRFLKYPNIPEGKAVCVITSDRYSGYINELRDNFHISVISPLPLDNISGSERYHADMSVCHLGEEFFALEKNNTSVDNTLKNNKARIFYSGKITAREPGLNVCILKNRIICRKDTADRSIIEFCKDKSIEILNVPQRYARCSTAVINENAVITTDESIYRMCRNNNIDALKIDGNDIKLEGYDCGFIGGCCGLISENELAFCGDITAHRDHENIRSFLRNYSVSPVSLGCGKLTDIGGLLPIMEEV